MPAASLDETAQKPLAASAGLAWLLVGLPVLLHGGIPHWRLGAWALAWTVLAGSFGGSLAVVSRRSQRWLLLLSVASILAMVLLLCDGFEGALLVLVAFRLGGAVSSRVGVGWIVVQSALLGAAVAVHWSPAPALLLAPPYLGFSLVAFFVADLLAKTAAQSRALAIANEELHEAQRLVEENSRLAERVRIARDLHDTVGHRLTALGMNLEVAAKLAGVAAGDSLASARALAKAALEDVRRAVDRLRDDDRIDLASTLRAMASELPSPRVHLVVADSLCRDDPGRAVTLLRCTQEIMTNAARHAQAENLFIEITRGQEGTVTLDAHDDGASGADVRPGHGLRGMRERVEAAGGTLEVGFRAGRGFGVRATIPARRA